MPELVTGGGRVFDYPRRLELLRRTLRYNGIGILVLDPQ
jgi:hypothetical protein